MKTLSEHPLARKIAIVTVIKLLGLAVIWWAFFSESGNHKLTPEQIGSAILHPATRTLTKP